MIADSLARQRNLKALITGESLGQVASQTAENMRFTGSYTDYPILRPLVGTDKEETIQIARKIGTYEVSIKPYEDCCVLFAAKHPLIKADFEPEKVMFSAMDLRKDVEDVVRTTESITLPFMFRPRQEP